MPTERAGEKRDANKQRARRSKGGKGGGGGVNVVERGLGRSEEGDEKRAQKIDTGMAHARWQALSGRMGVRD